MYKIRVFEAFSGIGAQAMSLKRLQADYPDMLDFEFVGTSEIEPSAIKAYNAVHGDVKCYGDITKIDWNEVPDFDLFTMSSPCQDFSVAGRQAGAEEGSGTRSSLLWECRKAIIAKRPKYILFENVSAVVSKKFIRGFNKWQAELEDYGYINFAKVLNSKDFGCPQNRERIFMVSILDCERPYHFPRPFKLEKRIKDILEPYGTVDESYYFSPEQLYRIIAHCDRKVNEGCGFKNQFQTEDDVSGWNTDQFVKEPVAVAQRGRNPQNPSDRTKGAPTEQRLEFGDKVANCVTTVQKDSMVAEPHCITVHPLGRKLEFKGVGEARDIAPCLRAGDCRCPHVVWETFDIGFDNLPNKTVLKDDDGKGYLWQDGSLWIVRKLTGLEYMRLMEVKDEDYYKMKEAGISKSAIYSLAGNSIVVDVLYHIFRKLWIDTENESAQKSLFDF